jgi:hypothetical protein
MAYIIILYYLRLANKNKRLRRAKEHRRWTEEFYLDSQHPGVASSLLRLVFLVLVILSTLAHFPVLWWL